MRASTHVRKGDEVIVIAGAHKGKRGKILAVKGDRVVIEKVAMVKRHQKATQQTPQGGIVEKEGTVHISNVQLFDSKLNRGTRTSIKASGAKDGDTKMRVGVKSGTEFPAARMA